MRRRTQAEMDQLVAAAGFRKIDAAHRRVGHLHGVARASDRGRDVTARRLVRAAQPPWRRALAWLAFLGPFFFATYGFANWADGAARGRAVARVRLGARDSVLAVDDRAVLVDRRCSTALSLFVCTTRARARHAREAPADGAGRRGRVLPRVPAALHVRAAADATASSARCSTSLAGFDQPFNQVPSLHIALRGDPLGRCTRAHASAGVARILLDGWFIADRRSVLTTYQHHFIDVPTGFAARLALRVAVADAGQRRARAVRALAAHG